MADFKLPVNTGERLTFEELTFAEFNKLHVLRRVSMESVWGLLEQCPVLVFAQGASVIEKGQSNQKMYLVLVGRLSVHLESLDAEPVAFLERGQTVGEISVIDDSPATAFVRAAEPTRLLEVDEETFWRMIEVSHEFSTNLLMLLAQRMRANNSKISAGVRLRKQLELEATVDVLTGLRNRRWLDYNLPRMIQRHKLGGLSFSLLMIDVDHFKKFNDSYGHAAGDKVLSDVARVVMGKLRPTDLAARYGGEEFVVMLPGTSLKGGAAAAERLRVAVMENTVSTEDGRNLPPVTISIGVAELEGDDEASNILSRADTCLYKAKENGRNRVEF